MAAAGASAEAVSREGSAAARMRFMCSHGGRFLPRGPDGGLRYIGGETRVIVVPREVTFRELTARLGEMAGGAAVDAVRYRLADDDDVVVSVTSDEEVAHMRDKYDRLEATRPSASFRVFFSGVQRRGAESGGLLPPVAPKMRRVQSEQALAAKDRQPMRRVQSAHQLAGSSRFQQCYYYDRRNHDCGCHRRRDLPVPPMWSLRSMPYKHANAAPRAGQEPATAMMASAESLRKKASGRDAAEVVVQNRRAFWELE